VAPACLALQDRHGLDVNLLLFAVWTGGRGVVLSETTLRAAAERVRRWHVDVVRPLRALRRRLKGDAHGMEPALAAAIRERIAAAELAAEHVEQLALTDLLGERDPVSGADAIEANLAVFARAADLAFDENDRRDLAAIVAAEG